MSAPPCFFAIFTDGNNFRDFLFDALANLVLPDWSLLSWEGISKRSKFFFESGLLLEGEENI